MAVFRFQTDVSQKTLKANVIRPQASPILKWMGTLVSFGPLPIWQAKGILKWQQKNKGKSMQLVQLVQLLPLIVVSEKNMNEEYGAFTGPSISL